METRLPFWREAPAREPLPAAHLTGFYTDTLETPLPQEPFSGRVELRGLGRGTSQARSPALGQ